MVFLGVATWGIILSDGASLYHDIVNGYNGFQFSETKQFSVGDTMSLFVRQESGGSLNIHNDGSNCFLEIIEL